MHAPNERSFVAGKAGALQCPPVVNDDGGHFGDLMKRVGASTRQLNALEELRQKLHHTLTRLCGLIVDPFGDELSVPCMDVRH